MSLTPIPKWMKQEVLERDGWNCLRCGVITRRYPDGKPRPDTTAFDHIVPEALKGMTLSGNLQILCTACNRWKGIQIIDFRITPAERAAAAQAIREEEEAAAQAAREQAWLAKWESWSPKKQARYRRRLEREARYLGPKNPITDLFTDVSPLA